MAAPAPTEGCRAAGADDLDRLAELADQAVAELSTGRGGEVWARSQARPAPRRDSLARDLDDPDRHIVVGTLDGVPMGFAVVGATTLADGGVLGVVSELYTEPGCRDVGIGELMMHALLDWCRERGCFGVDSIALPGDRHTKNFFESFGLVARAITVHRDLRTEEGP